VIPDTRNVAYARVYTGQAEPVTPSQLYDALYGRGFLPGFTDPDADAAPLADAGMADLVFAPGEPGFRVLSMTSSRGNGCRVWVEEAAAEDLPDEYLLRRAVPRPRLVYGITAGGPSNSDRNLAENIAEALLFLASGAVLIGGLGTKGNKPRVYTSGWVGEIVNRG
jgi:hypothetical protein